MIVKTHHDDCKIGGQLTGLTNSSPRDDLNDTDEDILKRAKRITHITDDGSQAIQCGQIIPGAVTEPAV